MRITFLPKKIVWEGQGGADLMTIAATAGVILDGGCGGKGVCGKCKVLVDGKTVVACQYFPESDITVELHPDEEMTSRKVKVSRLPTSFSYDASASCYHAKEEAESFGLAFDIGTTTVVGTLFNLHTARSLGVMARTNPQGTHGADVISRIQYVQETNNAGLPELQRLIMNCLDDIAACLIEKAQLDSSNLKECVVCGNTTMSHLAAGQNPCSLAFKPFNPAYTGPFICKGEEIGFKTQPRADFYLMPNIAGHVGSDITADLLALKERISSSRCLLIDIGTNGEIYGSNGTREVVCSTAAGPAFEGATITMGMRASNGAIERVSLDASGALVVATIGNETPVGICGSGIIDIVGLLVDCGIVDHSGRFVKGDKLDQLDLSADMKGRLRKNPHDGRSEFVLFESEEAYDVVITQNDIREVQLGKAAISAGVILLLRELEIELSDVDHLFVAGAFGNYIDLIEAQRIDLIPHCEHDRIEFVGNTTIAGASMCLLSRPHRTVAEELVSNIEHINLAEISDFQEIYLKEMAFR